MIINAKWVQLCLTNAEMNLLWPSRILSASLLQSLRLQPQLSAVSCARSQEWSRVLQWSQWNLVFLWCGMLMQQVSHRAKKMPPGWHQILGTQSECCSQDFTSMYNMFFLQLLGKSMPALVLLPVAMTGAAMIARSKSSSMSLGSFDWALLYQDRAVQ